MLLSAGKLAAGIIGRSGAMIADGVHSISDFATDLVVMIFVKVSAMPKDEDHDYGHGKFETLATILIGMALFGVAAGILWNSLNKVAAVIGGQTIEPPEAIAFVAAAVSIVVKESLYRYTKHVGEKVNSTVVVANAWHHRSDALSSVGALFGIAGARLGYPILDPLASVVICAFIGKAAFDIFREAVDKMMDHSCDEDFENEIRACALRHDQVLRIDLLRTREFGSRVYIEMEIAVDGNLPLHEAHAVAESVHNDIEASFPKVKHIMIHVNPA